MKFHFITLPLCILALTLVRAQQPQAYQQAPSQQHSAQSPDGSAYKNATLTYKITDVQNNTFGYDVFVNGKMTVHQTSIPAIPGNDGFKTKNDAIKVAKLVIDKIKKGEMPPTITTDELEKLKVIK